MTTLKELAYKKATTPKGAIAVIDNAMAQTKDPAQIAALSQARQALATPGASTPPAEAPNWLMRLLYPDSVGEYAIQQKQQQEAATVKAQEAAKTAPLTKPDPASGDFWKVVTGADGKTTTEFDGAKYDAAYDAWYAAMNAQGFPTSQYVTAPAGTIGQVGSGTDAKGNIYSAMAGPDGNTQMLNAQQIQQSVHQTADPQTSRDRAAADALVGIIKGWGLQDDVQVGEMGAITFPSPKALTAYTGIVSQRMLDVLRNGGTQVDALNAGGYQVVARESDAWKAYAAQQGGK